MTSGLDVSAPTLAACDLLRISMSTLERWERTRRLVPVRLSPGVVRYRRTDIERLLEEGAA
jgi:predicted site-specific integrase-resolvase